MRKTFFIIFIIFFLIACGAQNKSSESEEEVSSPLNTVILPPVISIDFPSSLTHVSNEIFVNNIQSIQSSINIERDKLKLLEQVIDKITEECIGLKKCHIEANHFSVKENNQSIFLGELDFNQYDIDVKYQYELRLKISHKELVTFKWSTLTTDVVSTYQKDEYLLNMHYFSALVQQKEVLYINKHQSQSQNFLMLSFDANKTEYRLRSNYVSKDESFSSNILVQNDLLLEENENIFELTSDFSTFKEGSYMLFSSMENIEDLNPLELFEKSLGSFLLFENKLQGFTYDVLANDILADEALIPVRISAVD